MIEKKTVCQIVEEWLEGKDYFLVEVTVSPDDKIRLPYPSVMASRAARAASGHTRVVAALSKYTGMVRSPHPWME